MILIVLAHASLSWIKPEHDRTLIKKQMPATSCDHECEVHCSIPPPPDCEEWGWCETMEWCSPRLDGCPPPPVYCDWDTQTSCWNPPPHNCERGCWGEEFCIPAHEMCPPPPVHCEEWDIKCSQPPAHDCEQWGDCNTYEFCMPNEEGCPPPPVTCDWETETSCWNPSPPECEVGCWGMEFCASHKDGCPPWPLHCGEEDVKCSHPAPEGCEEWGPGGCNPMEFCMPHHEGCPPPPVQCDWETQTLCYQPPRPDCEGTACWGSEFCSGPEGCPEDVSYGGDGSGSGSGGKDGMGLECGGDEVVCMDPPAPDCADWGWCEPMEWCMPMSEGCPPPPVNCDWETETSCWNPPPKDCKEGCWGHEFCVTIHDGCPMPPVECGEGELVCESPPPPDCADWGMCDTMQWCLGSDYAHQGCPPPPPFCNWETDAWCFNPPPEDCAGPACWGHEFCMPLDQGCPPVPITCYEGEMVCSHPPAPDCAEWGGCNPHEFCMPEKDGCPPPPPHCDWETEYFCSDPPPEDCEHGCWPTEYCARVETGCGGQDSKDKDDGGFFGLMQKNKLRGVKKDKKGKKNPHAARERSLFFHEQMVRTHKFQQHSKTVPKAVNVKRAPAMKKSTKTPKQIGHMLNGYRRETINYKRMIEGSKHSKKHKVEKKKKDPKHRLGNTKVGLHMMYEFKRIRMSAKKHPKQQKKQHAVRRTK